MQYHVTADPSSFPSERRREPRTYRVLAASADDACAQVATLYPLAQLRVEPLAETAHVAASAMKGATVRAEYLLERDMRRELARARQAVRARRMAAANHRMGNPDSNIAVWVASLPTPRVRG